MVNPAAGGTGRRRQDVDEGRRVVIGHPLAFGYRVDREAGAPDRLELGRGGAFKLLGRCDLDHSHGLEVGAV